MQASTYSALCVSSLLAKAGLVPHERTGACTISTRIHRPAADDRVTT
jgi:hypothetical protein